MAEIYAKLLSRGSFAPFGLNAISNLPQEEQSIDFRAADKKYFEYLEKLFIFAA